MAPFYHIIYEDWDASIKRQANQLDQFIQEKMVTPGKTILDVSCGIGTQSLGIASKGYKVTASDLSVPEVQLCGSSSLGF